MDFLPDELNEEMNIFAKCLRQSVKITTTINSAGTSATCISII